MALNDRQIMFCNEYLVDMNAVQAALRAGYKKETARYASKWINENENPQKPNTDNKGKKSKFNPEMRKYIDDLMAEKEDALIAKQDEVMKYLTSVMRREKTEHIVITTSKEKSTYKPDEQGNMRKYTEKEEIPQIVEIPAQLRDSNKAAELLGKAYGMYTDKIDADVDTEITITVDYGDGENEGE